MFIMFGIMSGCCGVFPCNCMSISMTVVVSGDHFPGFFNGRRCGNKAYAQPN
jgi:hypothetical protein